MRRIQTRSLRKGIRQRGGNGRRKSFFSAKGYQDYTKHKFKRFKNRNR